MSDLQHMSRAILHTIFAHLHFMRLVLSLPLYFIYPATQLPCHCPRRRIVPDLNVVLKMRRSVRGTRRQESHAKTPDIQERPGSSKKGGSARCSTSSSPKVTAGYTCMARSPLGALKVHA